MHASAIRQLRLERYDLAPRVQPALSVGRRHQGQRVSPAGRSLLVGAGLGDMLAMRMPPNGAPPGACSPREYYPPNCRPCPPADGGAFERALYNRDCERRNEHTENALRRQILAHGSKKAVGVRTPPGTLVGAGNTFTIPATTSIPLCIVDFDVSRRVAEDFLIVEIEIGNEGLITSGEGVTADSFSPDAAHPILKSKWLMPGMQALVTVENIDGAPHAFFGTLWGLPGDSPGSCLDGAPPFYYGLN